MTIKQLIDLTEEYRDEACYEKSNAESDRDGNNLWYYKGRADAFNEMLGKLDELLDARAATERNQ